MLAFLVAAYKLLLHNGLRLDFDGLGDEIVVYPDHYSENQYYFLLAFYLCFRYVQPRDAGIYECQVSTEPKMSHFVQLNIVGKFFIDHPI